LSGLEGIVRPFQTSEIGPPRSPLLGSLGTSTATSTTADAAKNTIINPGKDGQVKTFSGSFSLTITFYYIKKPKEKKKAAASDSSGGNPNPPPVPGNDTP
jgi:hypothetical protein